MNLQKICPACKTVNEISRETCIRCSGGLSRADVSSEAAQGAGKEDAGAQHQGLLILVSPEGRTIKVKDGDVVGRTACGREVLEIHEEISRRHARFVKSEGGWFVTDLGSSNGTFLDGRRINQGEKIPVGNGQRIMFSPVFQADVRVQEISEQNAVHSSEPDDEVPGGRRKTMVILFADLKGSVEFFQEKGTVVAHNWILKLYRMLSSSINTHRGVHIKNIGDAILAVFDDPREAVKAAIEMQDDLAAHNRKADETGQYYLRIGMNIGQVLFEDGDIFGNAVNIASRVQGVAPPERIYVTERLYEAVRDCEDIECRFIGLEQLKGVKEKTGIYEILCNDKKRCGRQG